MDRMVDDVETRRIDRCVAVIHRNRTGNTAHDKVWVRVFSAKDDLRNDELTMLVEHIEIMRDG